MTYRKHIEFNSLTIILDETYYIPANLDNTDYQEFLQYLKDNKTLEDIPNE